MTTLFVGVDAAGEEAVIAADSSLWDENDSTRTEPIFDPGTKVHAIAPDLFLAASGRVRTVEALVLDLQLAAVATVEEAVNHAATFLALMHGQDRLTCVFLARVDERFTLGYCVGLKTLPDAETRAIGADRYKLLEEQPYERAVMALGPGALCVIPGFEAVFDALDEMCANNATAVELATAAIEETAKHAPRSNALMTDFWVIPRTGEPRRRCGVR